MMSEQKGLPKGWENVSLGDVTEKISLKVNPTDFPEAQFIGMDCISPNALKPHFLYSFSDFKSTGNRFEKNHILYGRMRPYLNKVYKATFNGACSGEFIVLSCTNALIPDILQYILHHRDFVKFANGKTSGDRPRVAYEEISDYSLLLPPLAEQHRIVAKIEELLSDLDKGVESLKTARAQLKIYRQAVLKWAFEGKFTSDAPCMVAEPVEAADTSTSSVSEEIHEATLPEGWKWVILAEVTEKIQIGPFGSQLHREDYVQNGIPLINPMHIQGNKIIPDYSYSITEEKKNSLTNYILKEGDVIMGRRGEMGRCALVQSKENGWFCGTGSLYVRPKAEILQSKYLHLLISSASAKKYLEDNAAGTTMANLNSKIINQIPIPLPPTLAEQERIVAEIERRLSVCDTIEASIEASLQKADALRQSILKKAFEGKLVPQDPSDEPASVLLARVRAAATSTTSTGSVAEEKEVRVRQKKHTRRLSLSKPQ